MVRRCIKYMSLTKDFFPKHRIYSVKSQGERPGFREKQMEETPGAQVTVGE